MVITVTISWSSVVIMVAATASATTADAEQDGRPATLAGQHGVDQQLEHREQGAEDREQPQLVLHLGVVVAADEDHRDVGQQPRADGADQRRGPATRHEAADQGAAALAGRGHRGERDHHHELRQEQHRLGQDQAAGVEAGLVVVEHVAGDDDVGVREREERQQRQACCGSTRGRCAAAESCRPSLVVDVVAQQPPADRDRDVTAPRATPSIAAVSLGATRMNSVPKTSRGTPIDR